MTLKTNVVPRRDLLTMAATAGAMTAVGRPLWSTTTATDAISFYVVGDTHFLAQREAPGSMSEASGEICGRLVDTLNGLPGSSIPKEAGRGEVRTPRGVIHVGDIIDTGDKQGPAASEMQKTEWNCFTENYGLRGDDGRLKFPVYELHGNHDAPHGEGWALAQIKERNRSRPEVKNVSANGVHYAWDWGPVHFVNLGLIVGNDQRTTRKRRYAALDSLDFLIDDLEKQVGDSGRPVVLSHHVDIARYTGACEVDGPATTKEWDPCDVAAFYQAIARYKIAAIFYGHTHGRNVFRWDGESAKATRGVPVFNTDNASHFGSDSQAFFYVECNERQLVVREYQTKDRWKSGFFTPQNWSVDWNA